jgi:hypothetical protein
VIRGIKCPQISNSVLHLAEKQADVYVPALTETLPQSRGQKNSYEINSHIHEKTSKNVTKNRSPKVIARLGL